MNDVISAIALIGGGLFVFLASLGLVRFPDLLSRMHAATKAGATALTLLLLAVCLRVPDWEVIGKSIVALFFAFLTLPVAAHVLGRSSAMSDDVDKGSD